MRRPLLWAAPLTLGALLMLSACVASEADGDEIVAGEVLVTAFEVPGRGVAAQPLPNLVGSVEIPVRGYVLAGEDEPWATLVWAHGGSFVHGTLDWPEADWVSRRFADAGVRVISVDYVLASESVKAPALSNDVAEVLAWAGAEYSGPLVAGGASAGAQLAVIATLDQADAHPERTVDALLLEYPTLHRVQRADPKIADAVAALPESRRFRADRVAAMYDFYLGAGERGSNPVPTIAGELPQERLAQLPPTVIVNADADELRASGQEFAEQLRSAGVPVAEYVEPGTVHGYLNRPEETAQSRADAAASIERFVAELRAIILA